MNSWFEWSEPDAAFRCRFFLKSKNYGRCNLILRINDKCYLGGEAGNFYNLTLFEHFWTTKNLYFLLFWRRRLRNLFVFLDRFILSTSFLEIKIYGRCDLILRRNDKCYHGGGTGNFYNLTLFWLLFGRKKPLFFAFWRWRRRNLSVFLHRFILSTSVHRLVFYSVGSVNSCLGLPISESMGQISRPYSLNISCCHE